MSTYQSYRNHAAAQARAQREAVRKQREFARQMKERAKLDQLGQAQLEVAESENRFEVLLSLHKDSAPVVNWSALASALRPAEPLIPAIGMRRDWRLRRILDPARTESAEPLMWVERSDHPERVEFTETFRAWQKNKLLAERVLVGDEHAFIEALGEFSFLDEVAQLGTTIELTVHSHRQLEIDVRCNDAGVIPSTAKSLTSSGKVSEKQIPRTRYQEIYQDHVCSSLLRVAREAFAVLPIDTLLINGHATIQDSANGTDGVRPIYSVLVPRGGFSTFNFDRLDPSDAIESFPHRGDFKGSRKAGAFQAVKPFSFEEMALSAGQVHGASLASLRQRASAFRDVLSGMTAKTDPKISPTT